jgi:hypothetical protein
MPLSDAEPYLETALNRRHMRELLSEHVVPVLFPGHTLTKLPLQYSRYKAGKEHVALYRLELEPTPDTGAPLATATFGRRGRLERAYERTSANRAGYAPAALLLSDQPCLIEIFPSDAGLPLLWHAADASRATELLAPVLTGYRGIAVKRVDVLRYRPGRRCVLRYDVEHADGALDLVGKLYANPDRAQLVAKKLAVLSSQATRELMLAAPIGELANNGLLLMEHLHGSNLGDELEATASRDKNERAIRAAAAGLAAFHRFGLESSQRRSLQTELNNLRARLRPLHDVAAGLARDIEALLTQIEARLAALPKAAECVIHGEYKPNQLLLNSDQIALVDLDRACIGDPAIDVGNFAAVLRKEVLFEGHSHLAGLDGVFVREYLAANDVDGIVERAGLFQTIAFLRMLTRYFERAPQHYVRQGEDWPPLVLLSEARHSLQTS